MLAFAAVGLVDTKSVKQGKWDATFYFSQTPAPSSIPRAKTFKDYLPDGANPTNRSHFAVFLFTNGGDCYALSFGKSHAGGRPCTHADARHGATTPGSYGGERTAHRPNT